MDTILRMREVRYTYNGRPILDIGELDIARASITGLAGPNGSGKTTLLKLLSGVEKPASGSVSFMAANTTRSSENTVRQRLCLLPQEPFLLRRRVYDNIAYGLRIRGGRGDLAGYIHEALELVGLDSSFAGRRWNELSGGEAQRVCLAARLVLRPDCLMLDEPTASVDMESARCIRRAVLLARREWGTTLIIASHHRSWLNDICDRIIYLYNGRILACSFDNILTGPWETVDRSTVGCRLSDGQMVYACKPVHTAGSAIVSFSDLDASGPVQERNIKSLQGMINSITLDNKQDVPQAVVSCGDQRFMIKMNGDAQGAKQFWPGQTVTLHYSPEEITWLEK
ncbi:MAG: energy-coupling factor ABC transporter ATP-binding protein [Desulfobulbaceae bacterium]|nr:energy-coupling factor ABC transporter ATP-binding protein [Desulfobulbaceae bacterium]